MCKIDLLNQHFAKIRIESMFKYNLSDGQFEKDNSSLC